jgi:hypothetical protein
MKTLGTSKGIVLIFGSLDELRGVIDHLSGMLEFDEIENVPPPYLYAMFDDRIDSEEIEIMLDEMKNAL